MTRILVSTTLSLAGYFLSDHATCHMPQATLINNRLRGRWRNLRHQKIIWAINGPPGGLVPSEPNYCKAQLQAHRMTATASKTSPISLYPMLTDGGYALGSLSCPLLAVRSIKTASWHTRGQDPATHVLSLIRSATRALMHGESRRNHNRECLFLQHVQLFNLGLSRSIHTVGISARGKLGTRSRRNWYISIMCGSSVAWTWNVPNKGETSRQTRLDFCVV